MSGNGRRISTAVLTTLLISVVTVTGCSANRRPTGGSPKPSATSAAAAPPVETPALASPGPGKLPTAKVVDRLVRPELIATYPLARSMSDWPGSPAASDRYLVGRAPNNPKVVAVTDLLAKREVLRFTPDPKQVSQQIQIADPWLSFVELDERGWRPDVSGTPNFSGTLFDLRNGRRTLLFKGADWLPPEEPPTIGPGHLSYIGRRPDDHRFCVLDVLLPTGDGGQALPPPRQLYCAPVRSVLERAVFGGDVINVIEGVERSSGCRRLMRVPLDGGPATATPSWARCLPFNGAGESTWSVWVEEPPRLEATDVGTGLGAGPDGKPMHLGNIIPGRIQYCNGWAYWNTTNGELVDTGIDGDEPAPTIEIRRWKPDRDVEVIHRLPGGLFDDLTCGQRSIAVSVVRHGDIELIRFSPQD